MELYFLDKNFEVMDIIDESSSVVWSEKFHAIGTFKLRFPRRYVPRVKNAAYVRTSFADADVRCGRIERLSVSDDGDCVLSGHLLEVLLGDRVVAAKGSMSGQLGECILSIVEQNLRGCGVTLAEAQPQLCDTVTLTYSYNNLAEWLFSTLKPFGASFRVTLDEASNSPVFSLVVGKDRTTDSDSGEQIAVFSSSFGNIVSFEFDENTNEMKNVAYIEGEDKSVVILDMSGGGIRREKHVEADDISPEKFDSAEEYETALRTRGVEALAKCVNGIRVSVECDADALPRYGVDYALGDMCDVCDGEIGLSFELRLTSVDTVWENGRMTVFPSFGDEIRSIRGLLVGD